MYWRVLLIYYSAKNSEGLDSNISTGYKCSAFYKRNTHTFSKLHSVTAYIQMHL